MRPTLPVDSPGLIGPNAILGVADALSAIGRHAWTFAGSGRFSAQPGYPVVLTITQNPLCEGLHSKEAACAYYAADRRPRTQVARLA